MRRLAFVCVLSLAFAGAAAAQQPSCPIGEPKQMAELMFGRKIGDRIAVSEAAWLRFVDREITPRFPDGLTVLNAAGQWRDREKKRIVREPSKLVQIIFGGSAEERIRLTEIAEAYKKRFKQQSVAIILRSACVSF